MPDGGAGWARPWRSVRVRITLAAAVVAVLAMVVAGWLVLRAVGDTQTAKLRAVAEKRLEAVARQLRAGEDPQVAAEMDPPVQQWRDRPAKGPQGSFATPLGGDDSCLGSSDR